QELDFEIRNPSDVASRPRKALHQSCVHGIASAHEDDRDLRGGQVGGRRRSPSSNNNEVHAVPHEITGGGREFRRASLSKSDAQHEVLILSVAKLLEAVSEADDAVCWPPGIRQCADFDEAPGLPFRGGTYAR